jgi:hypothetical protein
VASLPFPPSSPYNSYEQDASSGLLTVHFRGEQQPPVTAGLLVAADGYFSRVRRQAVGDGPPAYGKTVVWRARLPAASAVAAGLDLQDSSSAFVQDLGRFFFAYPISSGDYVWTVGVSGEQGGMRLGVCLLLACGMLAGSMLWCYSACVYFCLLLFWMCLHQRRVPARCMPRCLVGW